MASSVAVGTPDGIRLWRAHGLGNDYLVLEAGPPLTPGLARALCDRHRGVGGDGVLEPIPPGPATYGVRIWNPDGSVAEKSGNGLRIFARFLTERRGAPPRFSVWTGSETVGCAVGDASITLQMGRATLAPDRVPVVAEHPVIDEAWSVGDHTLCVTAIATGNPHLVCFVDAALDDLPWHELGDALSHHPRMPNRANVQFAQVLDQANLHIRIFERGAGPTLASGSSSCAAAAAAVHTGRMPPGRIAVRMPGGTLWVGVSGTLDLTLEGPVEPVATIELHPEWIRAYANAEPRGEQA